MTSSRRTLATLFVLLITLVVAATTSGSLPLARAAASTPLTSDPTAISTSVALGTTRRIAVSLTNTSAAALTARLYEALPANPTASLAAALPADLAAVALPDQAERIDPRLRARAAADPDAPTDFLVFLGDQADLSAAYRIEDWKQRGQYVYETLRDHADRSQAELRSLLDARGVAYTPLWIVNALSVRGDAADLTAIAGRSEVALLRANRLTTFDDPADDGSLEQVTGCLPDAANVCWNLSRIGADRVWNYFGVRGAGITVANIDSGVAYNHPALVGQYRGNTGGGFDHDYNWYDPYADSNAPADAGNHGTHTMGIMAASGGASPSAPAVGVAPGVRWIAARACDATNCSDTNLIKAAQWMLAPTDLNDQNPRPDLRPQIVNNSWSSGVGNNNWYAGYVAAWRAAGIFPVFAAGNINGTSTTCSTINSPGDYAQVVGVGAIDSANLLSSFSRIGPSSDGRLKPDITAPGSGIASTISNLSYGALSGTSMATPHVAGSVALLWSANPDLIGDYDRTYQILTSSATPLSGDARFDGTQFSLCHASGAPNNIYGHGRLDVYAATTQAQVDVPWLSLPGDGIGPIGPGASASFELTIDTHFVAGPGTYKARILAHSADLTLTPLEIPVTLTVPADPSYATLSGKLTRASDGSPLAGTVTVTNGPSVQADSSGAYKIVLPPAATGYTLTASAFGYAPQVATLTLGPGEQRSYDFALDTDAPRLSTPTSLQHAALSLGQPQSVSFVLRNEGTRELSYAASLPAEHYGVWRSSQADGPAANWIDPPTGATTVGLSDDAVSAPIGIGFSFPYFSQSHTTLAIGANGFLSFGSASPSSSSYIPGCLPLFETPSAALIPLRVDLDPSRPGARVSYARIAEGFLVSWENVPLFNNPGQALSFQALLRTDGRVTLHYKELGALTPSNTASAGVQQNSTSIQSLGCGSSLSLSNGETIELRPQPGVAEWANLPSPEGSIPPGGEVSLPVSLFWTRNPYNWPASADILLSTNDPDRRSAILSIRMTAAPAPHTGFLPLVLHESP